MASVTPTQYRSVEAYRENRFSSNYNLRNRLITWDRNCIVWKESFKIEKIDTGSLANNQIKIYPGVAFVNDVMIHIMADVIITFEQNEGYMVGNTAEPPINQNGVTIVPSNSYFFLVLEVDYGRKDILEGRYKLIRDVDVDANFDSRDHLFLAKIFYNTDSDTNLTYITNIIDYSSSINEEALDMIEGDYIQISTIEQIALIGNDSNYPLDGNYMLMNDIDASDTVNWNVIQGVTYGFLPIESFTGTFNGCGFTISDLYINQGATSENIGMFSIIETAGIVRNLILLSPDITGQTRTGTICGYNFGTIKYVGCQDIDITTGTRGGGIAGANHGLIQDSYVQGTITNTEDAYAFTGGITSWCGGTITRCYSACVIDVPITATSTRIGGITGIAGVNQRNSSLQFSINVSYWDVDLISPTPASYYDSLEGEDVSSNVYGKTTVEMKTESTFTDVGWDFDDIWDMGIGYPYLQFEDDEFDSVTIDYEKINLEMYRDDEEVSGGIVRIVNELGEDEVYTLLDIETELGWFNTWGDFIEIATEADFIKIGDPDYLDTHPLDGKYVLINDIVLEEEYTPIGDSSAPFTGLFNGLGNKITGFDFGNNESSEYQAIFGYTNGAKIWNLGLRNGSIRGIRYVGGIVAYGVDTEIRKCYCGSGVSITCSASTSSHGDIGGIMGAGINCNINQCYSTCIINSNRYYLGGIIGYSEGCIISNSYSKIFLITPIENFAPLESLMCGISGLSKKHTASGNLTYITNCYSASNMAACPQARGITPLSPASLVSNSYFDSDVKGGVVVSGEAILAKTTENMKKVSTFGFWDFSNIWGIQENISYPFLLDNREPGV